MRPRQGLLSQPMAETDEELFDGGLHLRIKASVTTPKPKMTFMGDAGPGTASVPWTKMNEADKPGLPNKFRGHPLAFHLNALMEMAAQTRDPVAMKLIEEPFEAKRVTLAELLYGRHEGYLATRSLRAEIKRLEERAQHLDFLLRLAQGRTAPEMLVAMWNLAKVFGQQLPKFNSGVTASDLQADLDEVLNELVACEQLLEGQALVEAEWFLSVILEQRTFNQIVPQRMRLPSKRFTTIQAYLVNPVYKWNRKTKMPELISGEYWVPAQSVFPLKTEGDEFRTRITVHSYPVTKETGYTVSLWYVRDGKTVIPNPKDPLLEQYGPEGSTPSMNVHFRSRFEAEVERLGLRMTPWLDEFYRIGYRLVRDVFPDAVRWAQALCTDWHEGVEGLTEVDDEFASTDRRGRPIRTQVRFAKAEDQEDVLEVHTDREDLFLAMWDELRRFQDDALDKAIAANTRRHLAQVTAEMKDAYSRISVNPEWAWRKNQESGWSFQERVLNAGGVLDRALTRVREYPILPLKESGEAPSQSTLWKAFGYLGCERPASFVGTMVADRLMHANPGLPGFRLTDDGKRWLRPTAFEAWRFSQGPLGRLKNAIYAISYPKAGLEFLTPSLEAVRGSSIEDATYAHVSEQIDAFLGAELPGHMTLKRKQLVRQIVGLISLPTYGEADEVSRLIQVTKLLGADDQPRSELEQLTRQLWVQDPSARPEILEGLLSKDGRRNFGPRLWPMLRDLGILREEKVRPDPSCNRLSFCEPYVRTSAERLAW